MSKIGKYIQNAQNCIYDMKQYRLGYQYALKAFMLNQNNDEIKYMYAVALYFNDRCDEALKYFFELEKKGKYLDAIYVYIAHCLSKTRKNLFLALKCINKAIRNYKYDRETRIEILMIKAEIQYRMGDLDASLKNFMEAYELGDNDKSLCYIARIYLDKNQLLNAQKYLALNLSTLDDKELQRQIRTLTFEELKQVLIVLLNRYELDEYKEELDPDLDKSIRNKLHFD